MLNGYKSKPFNTCKRNDCVYKSIVEKKYHSFWNSDYHKNNNIKFLEKGYDQFNNKNKQLQDLFEQMFEFCPMKRIKAKDIEHHAWFKDMHANTSFLTQHKYKGELQHLYFECSTKKVQENDCKQNMDSIGSLYSQERTNKNNSNNNDSNNIVKIGYDSTQPSNESSIEISSYSEMMKQLKNEESNQLNHDNNKTSNHCQQIHKLLRRMSDNTTKYVKSQTKSVTNK